MTSYTHSLPMLSADGGLPKYLRDIRNFPVLTEEEEFMFAKRWQQHADVEQYVLVRRT